MHVQTDHNKLDNIEERQKNQKKTKRIAHVKQIKISSNKMSEKVHCIQTANTPKPKSSITHKKPHYSFSFSDTQIIFDQNKTLIGSNNFNINKKKEMLSKYNHNHQSEIPAH